jgi:membrane protein required for colicin V production
MMSDVGASTLTVVDWIIIAILAGAVLGGIAQGFLRSVFALGGLVLGLVLAAWNYGRIAGVLHPILHSEKIADTVGFLLIALVVMLVAGLLGALLSKAIHQVGLGCLDSLAGAVFGFFQGAVLVTVCLLITMAFFPGSAWLAQARLPKYFFAACDVGANVTPDVLAKRIRGELNHLEKVSPTWMHPGKNGV